MCGLQARSARSRSGRIVRLRDGEKLDPVVGRAPPRREDLPRPRPVELLRILEEGDGDPHALRNLVDTVAGMATVTLRGARQEDAERVAEIWSSGWRDGHLGLVPDELVEARTEESFRTRGRGADPGDDGCPATRERVPSTSGRGGPTRGRSSTPPRASSRSRCLAVATRNPSARSRLRATSQ